MLDFARIALAPLSPSRSLLWLGGSKLENEERRVERGARTGGNKEKYPTRGTSSFNIQFPRRQSFNKLPVISISSLSLSLSLFLSLSLSLLCSRTSLKLSSFSLASASYLPTPACVYIYSTSLGAFLSFCGVLFVL